MSTARVSIGLPVYNGERYLRDAVTSILEQTYTDFELILADNASTDSSLEIIEELADGDARIRVLRSAENRGASWNFNRTVHEARGELFRWAADDDLLRPTYLQRCVEALDAREDAVLAHTQTVEIDEHGEPIDREQVVLDLDQPEPWTRFGELVAHKHMCFPVFGLIRTETMRKTGLLGAYSDSDRVLLAELALRGRFVTIDEPLFLNRDHPERSTRQYLRSRDRIAWFDPSAADSISFPTWRQGYEFARAATVAPIGLAERARALTQMHRWLRWSWSWLISNVVRAGQLGIVRMISARRRGRTASPDHTATSSASTPR